MSPEEIWDLVREEPHGLRIDECDLRATEKALLAYRKERKDPELYGFNITIKDGELLIVRAHGRMRLDGGFRPMED